MNTLKIDDKWSVEYNPAQNNRPVRMVRDGEPQPPFPPNRWPVETYAMFYALLEAREVHNETAETDRPLEPPRDYSDLGMTSEAGAAFELMCEDRDATEVTHIHAALLAQDATGLFVTGLNAEEMEELRPLGQRTGGLIEVVPGKRKPMDSAGDLIRNYPDLATDLAADDEFTASFLNALADRVHATNVAAGWWTDLESGQSSLHTRNVGEMLMLIVSEISEALEAVRKNLMDDKLPHRPGLTVELADAVIRIADLAGALGLDLGGAIAEKIRFNAQRPDHKPENRTTIGGKAY